MADTRGSTKSLEGWPPTRSEAFVQQDAASASFSPLPASAWRDDDDNAAAASNNNNKGKMRFNTELCGGTVRVIDVSTPHGIEAARKYIAKRLPVIMRGSSDDSGASWPLLGPTLKKELSSASAIGGHLMGKQVTVLHAPQQASQRFTYYFSENAEEEDGDNNDMAAAPSSSSSSGQSAFEARVGQGARP